MCISSTGSLLPFYLQKPAQETISDNGDQSHTSNMVRFTGGKHTSVSWGVSFVNNEPQLLFPRLTFHRRLVVFWRRRSNHTCENGWNASTHEGTHRDGLKLWRQHGCRRKSASTSDVHSGNKSNQNGSDSLPEACKWRVSGVFWC